MNTENFEDELHRRLFDDLPTDEENATHEFVQRSMVIGGEILGRELDPEEPMAVLLSYVSAMGLYLVRRVTDKIEHPYAHMFTELEMLEYIEFVFKASVEDHKRVDEVESLVTQLKDSLKFVSEFHAKE